MLPRSEVLIFQAGTPQVTGGDMTDAEIEDLLSRLDSHGDFFMFEAEFRGGNRGQIVTMDPGMIQKMRMQ